jgi:transposase
VRHNGGLPDGGVADVAATERPTTRAERCGKDGPVTLEPVAQVARARAVLAVADGQSYTTAARLVGRRTGDTVARWVAGSNRDGPAAVAPRHGGGHRIRYGAAEQRRIPAAVARPPDRARDGTATWSLATLRAALRRAEGGLPGVGTHTIGRALHAAGFGWQKSRTWCATGVAVRRRKRDGIVTVADPDAAAKRG